MKITRYILGQVKKDLNRKMVLIGGPRQVGKTHLAKAFINKDEQYLNWDNLADREILKKHQINPNLKTVVFDEIHKYARWRMLLKGLFDKYQAKLKILVTGSAKLDHFRKGGDSLAGRFHYYRLHPLSLTEIDPSLKRQTTLSLLSFGGFPEPFLSQDESELRRWRRERLSRVVYQDISDLGTVKELSKIELLVDILPSKVASILSYNSIAEDLEVSPNTIYKWVDSLELIYYCYRVLPYGPPKVRAVKKSHKLYLWDWSEIESPGARFENMVAGHLLKLCHFLEDTQGFKMELRFIRNVDLKEIDFVVLKNSKPLFAVECKSGDKSISKHLYYYRERLNIPHYYQVHLGESSYSDGNISVLPFEEFCKLEQIP
jgi:predicted AAA+ superfamily ATPase